jgi:hypothetical protein
MVWSPAFMDTFKDKMKKTIQEGLKKKIRYIEESIMKKKERELISLNFF